MQEKNSLIENAFSQIWIEDGIVYFIYKQQVEIDIDAAKCVVSDRLKVQNGQKYLVFADVRGIKSSTNPARNYLAKEGAENIRANAILVGSPLNKIMVDFYYAIYPPLVPTKIFTSQEKALEWLKTIA